MLSACAGPSDSPPSGGWRQDGINSTQANSDETECRRRAQTDVDREVRRDMYSSSGSGFEADPIGRPSSYESQAVRYDAKRRVDRLTAECMRARGYAPKP